MHSLDDLEKNLLGGNKRALTMQERRLVLYMASMLKAANDDDESDYTYHVTEGKGNKPALYVTVASLVGKGASSVGQIIKHYESTGEVLPPAPEMRGKAAAPEASQKFTLAQKREMRRAALERKAGGKQITTMFFVRYAHAHFTEIVKETGAVRCMDVSYNKMRQILKRSDDIGFGRWGKNLKRPRYKYARRVLAKRFRFCVRLKRANTRKDTLVVFFDETWINSNSQSTHGLQDKQDRYATGGAASSGRGERRVIVDAMCYGGGCKGERLEGAFKTWAAKDTKGDYHGNFTTERMERFISEHVGPAAAKKAKALGLKKVMFVVDGAKYHLSAKGVCFDSKASVAEMRSVLNSVGVATAGLTSPDLKDLMKAASWPKLGRIGGVLRRLSGIFGVVFEMNLTPPYHFELQSTEHGWGVAKPLILAENTGDPAKLEALIGRIFEQSWTKQLCRDCVRHTLKWADHFLDHDLTYFQDDLLDLGFSVDDLESVKANGKLVWTEAPPVPEQRGGGGSFESNAGTAGLVLVHHAAQLFVLRLPPIAVAAAREGGEAAAAAAGGGAAAAVLPAVGDVVVTIRSKNADAVLRPFRAVPDSVEAGGATTLVFQVPSLWEKRCFVQALAARPDEAARAALKKFTGASARELVRSEHADALLAVADYLTVDDRLDRLIPVGSRKFNPAPPGSASVKGTCVLRASDGAAAAAPGGDKRDDGAAAAAPGGDKHDDAAAAVSSGDKRDAGAAAAAADGDDDETAASDNDDETVASDNDDETAASKDDDCEAWASIDGASDDDDDDDDGDASVAGSVSGCSVAASVASDASTWDQDPGKDTTVEYDDEREDAAAAAAFGPGAPSVQGMRR